MTVPLIHAAEIALGRQRSPEHEHGDYPVRYLRSANIGDGSLVLGDVKTMNFTPREQSIFGLLSGDVLVTEGSGSRDTVGTSAVWRGELADPVCFQNTLLRLRPRTGIADGRYMAWWARHAHAAGLMANAASGANILHLGAENVRRLPFPALDVDEQRRIADFLDDQVARIDNIIAARNQQQTLFNHASRSALQHLVAELSTGSAPTRLGRYLIVRSGDFLPSEKFVEDATYPVIGGNGVAGRFIRSNVTPPAVAVGRVGALCGNVHLITDDAWVTDNALVVKPIGCDAGYIAMVLTAADLNSLASRTAQPLLTGEVVKSVVMPIPDRTTQVETFERWRRIKTDWRDGRDLLELSVSRLQQLKRSLITAAVTGKFEVSSADGSRVSA